MRYKSCQSCGMPMRKDPQKGGSERDGTKSEMYCSYCYQEGSFTQLDFSAEEMKQFCKAKMKEMGYPSFLAGWFTLGIPRLKRWRK